MKKACKKLMVLIYLALDPYQVLAVSCSAAENRPGEGLGRFLWVPQLPGEHGRASQLSLSGSSHLCQPSSALLLTGIMWFLCLLVFFF